MHSSDCLQAHSAESRQLQTALQALEDLVQDRQRELSRSVLAPTIRAVLQSSYQTAACEHGPGTFLRMKEAVATGVQAGRAAMFAAAASESPVPVYRT